MVIMENLFYQSSPPHIFDLKGTSRPRFVETEEKLSTFEESLLRRRRARRVRETTDVLALNAEGSRKVLLDDNFAELTKRRPFPLKCRAKEYLQKAVHNDSMFLSVINVVDYSILVGVDDDTYSLRVGIIDYMRQYDIVKQMERMGKSVGMLTGQAQPTIIEPSQYRNRFLAAMDKYFMEVPDIWNS